MPTMSQIHRRPDENDVVGKEWYLCVAASADEKRRTEAPAHRHQGQAERRTAVGDGRRRTCNNHEQGKSRKLFDQPVNGERGVHRQEQHREAAASDEESVLLVSGSSETVAAGNECQATGEADRDANRRRHPVVLEGVAQEESHREHHQHHACIEQETLADAPLERPFENGFDRRRQRRRLWRQHRCRSRRSWLALRTQWRRTTRNGPVRNDRRQNGRGVGQGR